MTSVGGDPTAVSLRGLVAPILAGGDVPGATVALIIDGRIHCAGVGWRDSERRHLIDPDARFYLYSITKALVAAVALGLVERRAVTLDDPRQPLLPELPPAAPITLRQFLNHTAGIPDYGGSSAYHGDLRVDPARPWTTERFLAQTLERGLLFSPGDGWAYSNIGYLLLIERLTGHSLRTAIARAIIEPLGLTRTFVAETLDDAAGLTH